MSAAEVREAAVRTGTIIWAQAEPRCARAAEVAAIQYARYGRVTADVLWEWQAQRALKHEAISLWREGGAL